MKKTLVLVSISLFALWLASSCALLWPADKSLPIVSIPEVTSTALNEFNVRGYVIVVVICPPMHMCVRADGVDIAAEPVAIGGPDYIEQMRKLGDRGGIMTLHISTHQRFSLKVGQEYLFSFRKGRGVVGVSAIE